MIRVRRAPEPQRFEELVRQPGLRLLAELRGDPTAAPRPGPRRKPAAAIAPEALTAYWTRCLPELAKAFEDVCAYCCFWIDPISGAGTVDHFRAKKEAPEEAYEWRNLRYASLTMNRRKGVHEVCDPFEVKDGWFCLSLLTFGVRAAAGLEPAQAQAVQQTIDRLGLDTDEMRRRREDAWRRYDEAGRTPTAWRALERECPLIAREYTRQKGMRAAVRIHRPKRRPPGRRGQR